ncbi:MAG: hypothetical protein RLZ25_1833 [Pseudomonadota bacterium]
MECYKALTPLVLALTLTGCISESITSSESSSASFGSSSDSSSSPSKSSKKKASVPEEKRGYLNDIANLTNSVTGSKMTSSDFMNALSRTASQDQISNWESESTTYLGIGKGLKRATVPIAQIKDQPFLEDILARNQNALDLIQQGYKE